MFSEALTCNETWQLAPALDPRITLRWIMPGHPNVECVFTLLPLSAELIAV